MVDLKEIKLAQKLAAVSLTLPGLLMMFYSVNWSREDFAVSPISIFIGLWFAIIGTGVWQGSDQSRQAGVGCLSLLICLSLLMAFVAYFGPIGKWSATFHPVMGSCILAWAVITYVVLRYWT